MKKSKGKPKIKRIGPNLNRKQVNEVNKRIPCFYDCGNMVSSQNLICRTCRRRNARQTLRADKHKLPAKTEWKKRSRS